MFLGFRVVTGGLVGCISLEGVIFLIVFEGFLAFSFEEFD